MDEVDMIEQENEADLTEVKEDTVTNTHEFRLWKCLTRSTIAVLELLCEIVALSSFDSENDEDFEEVEDDDMAIEEDKIIDMDEIKNFCA